MESNKKKTTKIANWIKKDSTQAVLMITPMLIGFVLFTYLPIIYIG